MRKDAVWSNNLGSWVAPAPLHNSGVRWPQLSVCDIVITSLGYFKLYYKGRSIQDLTFNEYLDYRDQVHAVIGGELLV